MTQDKTLPESTGYLCVRKPLSETALAKIGNGNRIHLHVTIPFDTIANSRLRGLPIEIERATLPDLTRWRLDDLRYQPYAIDGNHDVELDVHATLSRILAENEVEENVRIPFTTLLKEAPELMERLIFERLATNRDNLIESYDTIELTGTTQGDLIVHVHATTINDHT